MSSAPSDDADTLRRVRELLTKATRVTVLTGAGISTDSGIPDFRGPQGLWTKNPKAELTSTLQHYLYDEEVRRLAWAGRAKSPAWNAQPNPGHLALVDLERRGRMHQLVTQNIDGLHERAGNSRDRIVEVHGTIRTARCWECGVTGPMDPFVERVLAGEEDPRCQLCGGIIKSGTILFGEQLVRADLNRAMQAARECDVLLAVGTTLAVYPVAAMVPTAHEAGAAVVIVNGSPTDLDHLATETVRGSISEVLPLILEPPSDSSTTRTY